MRITHEELDNKLREMGLIEDNGVPISFTKFKKLADIHQYGSGERRLFIIYIHKSRESIFGFYPPTCTRPEMLRISYDYLVDVITTEMKQEFIDGNVQWGNCGIPLNYSDLRKN